MNKRFESLKTWFTKLRTSFLSEARKKDNVIVFGAVFAALAVMLGVTAAFMLKPAKYEDEDIIVDEPVVVGDEAIRHPLTGEILEEELEQLPQVYAVMVENAADAWPLSGVEDAFLVIEAPVEGNIPRFEAFYFSDLDESRVVDKIGPVRSARPYYLDWASEFKAIYAHVGGSPEALEMISVRHREDFYDLNEFSQGEYYWRDTLRRAAPHNVYTSTDNLWEAVQELKPNDPDYDSWLFKADAPIGVDPLSLVINWGEGTLYDVEWLYDPGTNAYTRLQDGVIEKTQDGNTIVANNVVVMATDIVVIDSVGRRRLDSIGEGDALIVQDGKIILGRWKKFSADDRLRFYDAQDQEVRMNAGKTWIEVVPSLDRTETVTRLQ